MASPGMMNRRLTLLKPPTKTADSFGEPVSDASPTEYKVWGSWKESGGGEVVGDGQLYTTATITSDIWWHRLLSNIDSEWSLIGEGGIRYDIVATEELGGRRWQIRLKLTKRT